MLMGGALTKKALWYCYNPTFIFSIVAAYFESDSEILCGFVSKTPPKP
jgi:hypothetical protein